MAQRQQLPFAPSNLPKRSKREWLDVLQQFADLEKPCPGCHPGKKGNFAEFKDNLVCWARLKNPTDLLAWAFIVGFYSSE